MVQLASIVAILALVGAVASWVVGAVSYLRISHDSSNSPQPRPSLLHAIVAWPFARSRLRAAAAVQAAVLNKALVSFLACLIVAASAISVATNLARVSR